ncbi:SEC31A [Symbiodinium natans]|uniref:SEC31A protein n=1 Tax=Symbiodinium natans TaxID=878477 RepID=A0A812MM76_9DINO|nr:SEC31A [Symbiodinium natans]
MGVGGPVPGGVGGPVPGGVGGGVGGWAKPAPAPAPPMPPGKSTAPTASAMPVTEGLPVAWPLPTKAMQKLSTNQSVADANIAIQEMSGSSSVIGEPLPPHDLAHVKNVFTLLLDSSQDNNPKKREDIMKKLEELYGKLQTGQLKTATSQKVLQLAKAMEAQDYATAQKVQQELSVDWDTNKSWLMGVKRLITR